MENKLTETQNRYMEAKDKAEELVKKFENVELLKDYSGMWSPLAIECAIICVDEIIEENRHLTYYHERMGKERQSFYEEVKSELEKMKV